MEHYSAADAQKKFDALPLEIQTLLYSPKMTFTLQQVGVKNKLHLDQIDILNTEAGQLLLGFIEPKDFPAALIEALGVSPAQADEIARDTDEMLLTPIRDVMKTMNVAKTTNTVANLAPMEEKSVVMPSSISKTTDNPITITKPVVTPPPPATTAIKPADMLTMPHVDAMLTQPTVSIAPEKPAVPAATAPTPAEAAKEKPPAPGPSYTTDPYHEPVD